MLLGERCVATADPFNEAAAYRSVRDVPTDAYDAAVLAIPDDDKIDLVTYLLEHGKHILVEKPLPLPDEETAWRLELLARERGLALYTAYNHRFEPMLSAFQQQVESGTIGEVYHGRLKRRPVITNNASRAIISDVTDDGSGTAMAN